VSGLEALNVCQLMEKHSQVPGEALGPKKGKFWFGARTRKKKASNTSLESKLLKCGSPQHTLLPQVMSGTIPNDFGWFLGRISLSSPALGFVLDRRWLALCI
jgi:hypothetical protein